MQIICILFCYTFELFFWIDNLKRSLGSLISGA